MLKSSIIIIESELIIMFFKKRHTMQVKAKAVYNEDKGIWEVKISQKEFAKTFPSNKWKKFRTTNNTFEISECDEFVIPWAILEDNGINTSLINECLREE